MHAIGYISTLRPEGRPCPSITTTWNIPNHTTHVVLRCYTIRYRSIRSVPLPIGGVPNPVFGFWCFLEMGAILDFRAKSQEESHTDVIGYLTRTSDDVVGDKCWTVMLKCQSHKCFRTKTCFFIRAEPWEKFLGQKYL